MAQDGSGGTDELIDIEAISGALFDDRLFGGNAANDGFEIFDGREGDDTVNARGRLDDNIRGHDGGNVLDGNLDDDLVRRRAGSDVLGAFEELSPGTAMLNLGGDNDVIFDCADTGKTVLALGDIII